MNNVSCWDLIAQNRFEEAIKIADLEFKKNNSALTLRNKIIALLQLRRYEQAFGLCNYLIGLEDGESESDFKFAGVALWLQEDRLNAIKYWKEGLATNIQMLVGELKFLYCFFMLL